MFLETERLIIRKFKEADFEDFCEFTMDEELCRMMGRDLITDANSARPTFDWLMNKEERGYVLEYKENHKVIGNLTVGKVPPHVQEQPKVQGKRGVALSFSISRNYQRKGLMSEAVSAVTQQLFKEGMEYINCGYLDFNMPSAKLQEKLGFCYLMTESFPSGEGKITCVECILWNQEMKQNNVYCLEKRRKSE